MDQNQYQNNYQNQNQKPPMPEEDRFVAKALCIVSIVFLIAPVWLQYVKNELIHVRSWFRDDALDALALSKIDNVKDIVSVFFLLVALALMVLVRIRYRDYVFGKVLMWLYIIFIVGTIIAIILFVLTVVWLCKGFPY